MSKGLRALERVRWNLNNRGVVTSLDLDIIEEELKEYESYRGFLDNVEKGAVTYTPRDVWEEERKKLKRLEELEKAFKALSKDDEKAKKLLSLEIEKNRAFEIIKNKCSPLLKQYLLDLLPKEESKLVEEVLCEKEQKI